ncbi:diaminohydroxyphosphoribosylaminopyrimidine deaminase [Cutibacterium acnes JCM 18916]|nr:diaminohydroxyphosphoribosylaminopyrimidine deaminase [Cutibacterium acnes JCM 18916]
MAGVAVSPVCRPCAPPEPQQLRRTMDQRWDDAMALALDMAAKSPCPDPNPRVGCVIVAEDRVIGQGWHRGAGTPHAEVEALRQAGDDVRGATAVVTLEPCHHTGRTGPCSHALVDAGIARVVIAQSDPNPVASGGEQWLRTHGVEVVTGVLSEEATASTPIGPSARSTDAPGCAGSTPRASTDAALPPTEPASGSPGNRPATRCSSAGLGAGRSSSAPELPWPITRG